MFGKHFYANAGGQWQPGLPQLLIKFQTVDLLKESQNGPALAVQFRVKAPVTRRPLHRPGGEDFPHPVPRFRPFLPSPQPIRRHPDWRITLLPCKLSNIMDYSGERQGKGLENSSELLMTYAPIPVAFSEPASPRFFSVFVHHLQHLIVSPHPKILVKPPQLAT